MPKFADRAKVLTTTTGTGTITLGAAVPGFQTFASAGIVNGDQVSYVVEDSNNWEIGSGTYSSSGTSLTRSVLASSNSGSAINLSGSAVVYISALSRDLNKYEGLSGRNLIINGSGRINQESYVSGASTSGANQFTLDQWFVITSGQSLTFTGDTSGRVMTAPAGGVSQVIEGANIVGGTYVLNWNGTATATVGGVARTKGETFSLTANTNVTVTFASGTFSEVQLERGSVVTPFEWRSIGQELALCQRYYEKGFGQSNGSANASGHGIAFSVGFSVAKRAAPTIALSGLDSAGVVSTANFVTFSASVAGFVFNLGNTTGAGGYIGSGNWAASARLTS